MWKNSRKGTNEQVTEQELGKIHYKIIMIPFFILSIGKIKKVL